MRDRMHASAGEQRRDERVGGQVALRGGARCADPLDLRACLGERRAIRQQQFRAKLGHDDGGCAADAAGRAGDQRAPASQVQCGR